MSFQTDFAKNQPKLFEAVIPCEYSFTSSQQWKITEVEYELIKYFCKEEERKLERRSTVIYQYSRIIERVGSQSEEVNCIVEDIRKKLSHLYYVEMNQMVSDKFYNHDLGSFCTSYCLVCKFPNRGMLLFSPQKDLLFSTYETVCNEFEKKKAESEYSSAANYDFGIHSSSIHRKKMSNSHTLFSTVNQKNNEECNEEKTFGSLRVKIYEKSILGTKVEAIVNAANKNLTHETGVSRTICEAAGHEYMKGCRQLLKENAAPSSLKTSKCYWSNPGGLRSKFRYILHAVAPCWIDFENDKDCSHCLAATVKNILETADSLRICSVAMPALGSGTIILIFMHKNLSVP